MVDFFVASDFVFPFEFTFELALAAAAEGGPLLTGITFGNGTMGRGGAALTVMMAGAPNALTFLCTGGGAAVSGFLRAGRKVGWTAP